MATKALHAEPVCEVPRRARRPNWHYFDLAEVERLLDIAEALGRTHKRGAANALRVRVAVYTGLRAGELHALEPDDVRPDGTVLVRMQPHLKRQKPRVAAFVDGLAESPTLAAIRERIDALPPGAPLWPSGYAAWLHWVDHRLGFATGLQRRIVPLNGNRAQVRYRVHPHALRAAFVTVCRQWPRRHGRKAIAWETIAELGGWDSVDTLRRYYYGTDLDNALDEIREAIPVPRTSGPVHAAGVRR